MPKTLTRPPETPLDDTRTQRRGNLRSGQTEIWQAYSADGTWLYERLENVGTTWVVEHYPTGLSAPATNLADARRWTATPAAIAHLTAQAERIVRDSGHTSVQAITFVGGLPRRVQEPARAVAERLGLATRALQILAGRLSPATPDSVCTCGHLLTWAGTIHADACRECVGQPFSARRNCMLLHEHPAYHPSPPDPVQCDHRRCVALAAPYGDLKCRRGRDWCCGCC